MTKRTDSGQAGPKISRAFAEALVRSHRRFVEATVDEHGNALGVCLRDGCGSANYHADVCGPDVFEQAAEELGIVREPEFPALRAEYRKARELQAMYEPRDPRHGNWANYAAGIARAIEILSGVPLCELGLDQEAA